MPRTLSQLDIEKIQAMRYQGASNEAIKKAVPLANDSLIGTYAPSELRGGKRRLAEYIGENKGIDFKDINFRAIDIEPNRAAGQLKDLRRAGLLVFKEGKIAMMGGEHHNAGNTSEKGIYSIYLTPMGIRRVEASKIIEQVAEKSSEAHAAVAEKMTATTKAAKHSVVAGQTEAFGGEESIEIEPIEEAVTATEEIVETVTDTPPMVELAPEIVQQIPTLNMVAVAEKYPILAQLRRKEGRIHAANRLVSEASHLYESADLTEEAIALLEHLAKTEVKFTPIEVELMRLAEDMEL